MISSDSFRRKRTISTIIYATCSACSMKEHRTRIIFEQRRFYICKKIYITYRRIFTFRGRDTRRKYIYIYTYTQCSNNLRLFHTLTFITSVFFYPRYWIVRVYRLRLYTHTHVHCILLQVTTVSFSQRVCFLNDENIQLCIIPGTHKRYTVLFIFFL